MYKKVQHASQKIYSLFYVESAQNTSVIIAATMRKFKKLKMKICGNIAYFC